MGVGVRGYGEKVSGLGDRSPGLSWGRERVVLEQVSGGAEASRRGEPGVTQEASQQ